MTNYTFKEVHTIGEMKHFLALIQQLSPALTRESYERMLPGMIQNGYFQVAVYDGDKCIGISGCWINTKLYSGKYLDMDNVVIDAAYRSKGVGKLLCDWCINKARENESEKVMLDAYLENENAHRFYEREGFIKRGYHFLKSL